jgi:hypothetical protein
VAIQGSGQLEQKRVLAVGRAVTEGRHLLIRRGALLGHDLLHDLVAAHVLANENEVVAGASPLIVQEAEGQDVLAAEFLNRFS